MCGTRGIRGTRLIWDTFYMGHVLYGTRFGTRFGTTGTRGTRFIGGVMGAKI